MVRTAAGRDGLVLTGCRGPAPRQELVQPAPGNFEDAGQDVSQPGPRVDVVELGRALLQN